MCYAYMVNFATYISLWVDLKVLGSEVGSRPGPNDNLDVVLDHFVFILMIYS